MRLFHLLMVLCVGLMVLFPSPVWAAKDVDFSCKGLYLGDSEEQMKAAFGEPLFDRKTDVFGIPVIYYWFGHGYEVGISPRTGKVVDMKITDDDYQARAGVRYGSTPHKIQATFGNNKRQQVQGATFYVYEREGYEHQRLLLRMDSETVSLRDFRITSLPLTAGEAEAMMDEEFMADKTELAEKGLDLSAMPEEEPARLVLKD